MKFTLSFLLIICAIFFQPSFVDAQTNYEDVVYLKNGSVIHGTIIEQIPNESIKIQTKDRNVFVYKMDEILKLTKEETQRSASSGRHVRESASKENIKKKGYTNITELSFAKGIGTSTLSNQSSSYNNNSYRIDEIRNSASIGVQSVNGYQFSPYVSLGAGVGIYAQTGIALVPLFVDVRGNFLTGRITPFVSVQAGATYTMSQILSSNIGHKDKGGLMISSGVGVKFFVVPKMALNLSLGFRYQELKIYNDYYYSYSGNSTDAYYTKEILRLFNVRFGFTF